MELAIQICDESVIREGFTIRVQKAEFQMKGEKYIPKEEPKVDGNSGTSLNMSVALALDCVLAGSYDFLSILGSFSRGGAVWGNGREAMMGEMRTDRSKIEFDDISRKPRCNSSVLLHAQRSFPTLTSKLSKTSAS